MEKVFQVESQFSFSEKRKHFTENEDQIIKKKVAEKGPNCWKKLGFLLNRNPKQIRDRYNHYLKEPLSKESWSPEEDLLLINLMKGLVKNKWSDLEKILKNRNQIQIKNRWRQLSYHQQNHLNSDIPTQLDLHRPPVDIECSNFSKTVGLQPEYFHQVSIPPSHKYTYSVNDIPFQPFLYHDESVQYISSLLNRPTQIETEKIKQQRFQPIETFFSINK
jgi:hypothetical protein